MAQPVVSHVSPAATVRCDLEGKGFVVPDLRTAVQSEAGNAEKGELHRQHIARLAARVVTGRLVNRGNAAFFFAL
jgi:hypothetical protein